MNHPRSGVNIAAWPSRSHRHCSAALLTPSPSALSLHRMHPPSHPRRLLSSRPPLPPRALASELSLSFSLSAAALLFFFFFSILLSPSALLFFLLPRRSSEPDPFLHWLGLPLAEATRTHQHTQSQWIRCATQHPNRRQRAFFFALAITRRAHLPCSLLPSRRPSSPSLALSFFSFALSLCVYI